MLPADREERHPRRLSIRLATAALLFVAACATAPEQSEPPLPLEAVRAHAEARAWLRSEGESSRRLARQAAERAAALAPDWVAPQRLLDDLLRDDLLGLEALRGRRAAARQRADSGASHYLAGRLEGAAGRARFERAVEVEPELAWGWHGRAWSAAEAGDAVRAYELELEALARALDSWERSYFTAAAARYLRSAGRIEEAVELLLARLDDSDLLPADRTALGVQAAEAEMGLLFDPAVRERGFDRGLDLLREEHLTEGELRQLTDRMVRHGGRRSREELLLEIQLALASRADPAREDLRTELMIVEGPSALALELVRRRLPVHGGPGVSRTRGRSASQLRAWRFAVGEFRQAVELWLADLPSVCVDADGLPLAPELARVVQAVRVPELTVDAQKELGDALVDAGWFREARAVAARMAATDLDLALELETRAAAGRALVYGIARAGRAADPAGDGSGGRIATLDELLIELADVWSRFAGVLDPGADGAAEVLEAARILTSPRIDYGPFADVLHPGPLAVAADEERGIAAVGAPVPGLASALGRLGRFGVFGQLLGSVPDGVLLRRVAFAHRSGEHLGVPWEGTVVWGEGLELASHAGRRGARLAGAAVHEGYWIDLDSPRADLARWRDLEDRFFGPRAGVDRAARALAVEGLALPNGSATSRHGARTELLSPLGEGDRLRIAVLRDRRAERERGGALGPTIDLDELVEAIAVHEEGHLCDRTRFLPLAQHPFSALRFLARAGFTPASVARRLEYRAELVALCQVVEPRIVLAGVVDAAEGGSSVTAHAAAYRVLLRDFLFALDQALERDPERWAHVDPDRTLVHQLFRLDAEDVRELALVLAVREGLVGQSERSSASTASTSGASSDA